MPADRLLDARDLGLDLVDDGDPPVREYCQEVDRATFAPFGERDFRGESPAGGCERAGGSLDQLSVSCVGQPVEVTTTPADNSLEPCVEQGEDAADDFNGESRQMPALEAGNSGLVTTGGSRQVELYNGRAQIGVAGKSGQSVVSVSSTGLGTAFVTIKA